MKTNHRRSNPNKGGFDYSHQNFSKRLKLGLGADHVGGHQGSAKDIKAVKTATRRSQRRQLNRISLDD